MSDTAPPGWYPDASGTQRYWDGSRWLDTPPAAPPAAPQGGPGPRSWADGGYGGGFGGPQPGPPPRKSRAGLYAVLGVVAVVLVAALVTTLVLVTGGDDTDEQAGDGTSQTSGPGDRGDPGDGASTDEPEESEPADDRPDPADTVQDFLDAALDGDCDTLEGLVTDRYLGDVGDCDPDDVAGGAADGVEFTVGDSVVDGDTATVVLMSSYEGETAEFELDLVFEDDRWLIDDFNLPDAPTASAPSVPSPS